jgi:hypothetical protein
MSDPSRLPELQMLDELNFDLLETAAVLAKALNRPELSAMSADEVGPVLEEILLREPRACEAVQAYMRSRPVSTKPN